MWRSVLVLVALLSLEVLSRKTCREKILQKYPQAKCVDVDKLTECTAECEHLGEKKCQGSKGEIRKLNCKHNKGHKGSVTCCCE